MSITRTKAEKKTTNEKDSAMTASTSATNGSSGSQWLLGRKGPPRPLRTTPRNETANGSSQAKPTAAAPAANVVNEPIADIDRSSARSRGPTEESYDEVPYPGGTYRATHPSHLAMVARLCGISPAPPAQCRVLELGCSMGANIVPMAAGPAAKASSLASTSRPSR